MRRARVRRDRNGGSSRQGSSTDAVVPRGPRQHERQHDKREYGWVFTSYHPDDPPAIERIGAATYIVYQAEICPDTGREHLQGYIHFKDAKTLLQCKRLLGHDDIHCEKREGSIAQAINYCTKADTRKPGVEPVEQGKRPAQGARTDLQDIGRFCFRADSLRSILQSVDRSNFRYLRFMELCFSTREPPRRDGIQVYVFIGPPGSGKTYRAFERWPGLYLKDPTTKWWDGYNGESEVLIDNFSGTYTSWSRDNFLELCSWVPYRGERKGGFVPILATTIVITSIDSPECWFPGCGGDVREVTRRIHFREILQPRMPEAGEEEEKQQPAPQRRRLHGGIDGNFVEID